MERIPILKLGTALLVTIQVDMQDQTFINYKNGTILTLTSMKMVLDIDLVLLWVTT